MPRRAPSNRSSRPTPLDPGRHRLNPLPRRLERPPGAPAYAVPPVPPLAPPRLEAAQPGTRPARTSPRRRLAPSRRPAPSGRPAGANPGPRRRRGGRGGPRVHRRSGAHREGAKHSRGCPSRNRSSTSGAGGGCPADGRPPPRVRRRDSRGCVDARRRPRGTSVDDPRGRVRVRRGNRGAPGRRRTRRDPGPSGRRGTRGAVRPCVRRDRHRVRLDRPCVRPLLLLLLLLPSGAAGDSRNRRRRR
mmetsp:Transcript_12840/g.50231  ORF Transcript_12840/g.50231 Transcript_12840/m.50231 type:complete len:245 (-) Transcript_12840:72-806(-)